VLCGAGVKSSDDVARAIELGADGVLLASGIVRAKDPYKACEEIFRGV
jgi:triosephosphate isomerase